MGFMEPEMTEPMDGWEVETTAGTYYVPGDVESDPDALRDYVEGEVREVKRVHGVFGRMSAPGYLDCTDWTFGATVAEVEDHLNEYYGEDEGEDEDVDESAE